MSGRCFAIAPLILIAATGPAAATEVRLSTSGCDWDRSELRRLVSLELSDVSDTIDYDVGVECEADSVRLWIVDPVTGKRIQREAERPPPEHPEPERLVALTLAQLYRASWLELLADDPSPLPPKKAPETTPRETAAAQRAAQRAVARTTRGAAWFVGLGGEVQHRGEMLFGASMSGGVTPTEAMRITLRVQFLQGTAQRNTGKVDVKLISAAFGATWRSRLSTRWFFCSELLAGPTFVQLEGERTAPGFTGAQLEGWGLGTQLKIGPAVVLGSIELRLSGLAGAMLGAPTGHVANDDDVMLDGLLFGTAFDVKWNPRKW